MMNQKKNSLVVSTPVYVLYLKKNKNKKTPSTWEPEEHMKPCLSSLTVSGPIGSLNAFIVRVESAFGAGWGFWQLLGVWYIFSEERLLATTRRRLNKHSDRDPHLPWGGSLRKVTDSVDHETEKRTGGVNEGGVRRTVKVLCLRFHPNPHWN